MSSKLLNMVKTLSRKKNPKNQVSLILKPSEYASSSLRSCYAYSKYNYKKKAI